MKSASWLRAKLACTALQLQTLPHARSGRWRRAQAGGEDLWLDAPEGRVAATLHLPKRDERVPALVLMHGSHGPLALYARLAERFAQRGFATLCLELQGFGRSPAAQMPYRVEQFTGKGAISAAVVWLRARREVDGGRIHLLGHSFGGSVVLASGVADTRLASVIALGPTRRVEERTLGPAAKESAMWRARFAISRRLTADVSMDLVAEVSRAICLEYHIAQWQKSAHPAVALIDGERESRADQAFLKQLSETISPPVVYWTVPQADHYLNSASFGRWVYEDRKTLELFVDWIAEWVARHRAADSSEASGPSSARRA